MELSGKFLSQYVYKLTNLTIIYRKLVWGPVLGAIGRWRDPYFAHLLRANADINSKVCIYKSQGKKYLKMHQINSDSLCIFKSFY